MQLTFKIGKVQLISNEKRAYFVKTNEFRKKRDGG